MQTETTTINDLEKQLQVTLDWGEIQEEYNDLIARYAKFPLKGFREGKVPTGLIETTYKNELREDLVSACAPRFCRKAMDEQQLQAASPVEVSNVEFEKGKLLSFIASFVEMPEFSLPDYKTLNVTSATTEEKLDEVSMRLLEQTPITIHSKLIDHELEYSEIDPEEASDDDKSAAEARVKLMMILKKIAAQDNVEVDRKDVELRIEEVAQENDVTADQLRDYLQQSGGMERLTDTLLAEQVLAYVISLQ